MLTIVAQSVLENSESFGSLSAADMTGVIAMAARYLTKQGNRLYEFQKLLAESRPYLRKFLFENSREKYIARQIG